jgi:two-component system NtrC family response regulator
MARLCKRWGLPIKGVSPEFIQALSIYDWPGNVRELFNAMEKVFVTARHDTVLYPKHLPNHVRIRIARSQLSKTCTAGRSPLPETPQTYPSYRDFRAMALHQAEHEYLSGLLTLTHGNIPEACGISRLSQSRLYELLKKHRLTRGEREAS